MTSHQKLADWVDGVVTRNDNLVKVANGNHCLAREGGWDRSLALSELFKSLYDKKTVDAILVLLQPDMKTSSMTGLEAFEGDMK